jgi:inner membrane protein
VAQALLPVALTAFCIWLDRRRQRTRSTADHSEGTPPLRAGWVMALSVLGIYSHVFLDYLNNYGVRLLAPFDWRWFYGDTVFIIDPWLWTSLGLGVWLARRTGRPRPARLGLAVAVAYVAVMMAMAQHARTFVAQAWLAQTGTSPRAFMVGPVPVLPWRREVIIDTGAGYRTGWFTAWPAHLELAPELVPKGDELSDVTAARTTPAVAPFLVWARFPFWQSEPAPGGTDVTVRDMRFRARLGGGFVGRVIVPGTSAPVGPSGQGTGGGG